MRALVSGYPEPVRRAWLMMVLQACLDDSGEMEETINPVFVLAGFLQNLGNGKGSLTNGRLLSIKVQKLNILRWLKRPGCAGNLPDGAEMKLRIKSHVY